MTKKHALQYFICSLNVKSHNFQTESHFKRVTPTYRGSTTLNFLVLRLCSTLRRIANALLQETRSNIHMLVFGDPSENIQLLGLLAVYMEALGHYLR
jgi:hypothetical protein